MKMYVVFVAIVRCAVGQISDIATAQSALTSIATEVRARADAVAAGQTALTSACSSYSTFVLSEQSQRNAAISQEEAVIQAQSTLLGESDGQATHLAAQIEKEQETYNSALAMRTSQTKELKEQYDSAEASEKVLSGVVGLLTNSSDPKFAGNSGEIRGVLTSMVWDVRDTMIKTEREIKERSDQYTAIMNTSRDQIVTLNEEYHRTYATMQQARHLIRTSQEMRTLQQTANTDEYKVLSLYLDTCNIAEGASRQMSSRTESVEGYANHVQTILRWSLIEPQRGAPRRLTLKKLDDDPIVPFQDFDDVGPAPKRVEFDHDPVAVAAETLDVVAKAVNSSSLHRLAGVVRTHPLQEDMSLIKRVRAELDVNENSTEEQCDIAKIDANAQVAQLEDEVDGLQAANKSAFADQQALDDKMEMVSGYVSRINETSDGLPFGTYLQILSDAISSLTAQEQRLTEVEAFVTTYAVTPNVSYNASSLPAAVSTLSVELTSLKERITSKYTNMFDASTTTSIKVGTIQTAWMNEYSALESTDRTAAATANATLVAKITALEAARAHKNNVTIECDYHHVYSLNSLHTQEVRALTVAEEILTTRLRR